MAHTAGQSWYVKIRLHTQPDTIQDPEHSHRRPQAHWMQPKGGWHDHSAQQWRRARLLPLRYVIVTPEIGPNSCKIHPTVPQHTRMKAAIRRTKRAPDTPQGSKSSYGTMYGHLQPLN